jgi:hypothetical protein
MMITCQLLSPGQLSTGYVLFIYDYIYDIHFSEYTRI